MPLEVEPETLEDSPNWYKLLYSCTRTNPAKRPQSVEELISLLKAIETQQGKHFQFEIVTVNSKGEIIRRKQKQARCQTEELGNGVMLEMIYIPGERLRWVHLKMNWEDGSTKNNIK